MSEKPFTALLDTCSFRNAPSDEIVLESLDGSVPSLSGPRNSLVRMVMRRGPRIPKNEGWRQIQSTAMPSIARLARDGKVHLFTYSELEIENFKGTLYPLSLAAHSLTGVAIDRVPAAVERSKFQQMDFRQFAEKEAFIDYCKWILSLNYKNLMKRPGFSSKFTDFELRNLESLDRFKHICRNLSEKHYPDAFHLWTAEANNLHFFLTADKKFIRAITKTSRVNLTTKPISPSEFLEAAQMYWPR
jgi:hypothetical protein